MKGFEDHDIRLFVPRQSTKSGGTSHNQKAFKAKSPFNRPFSHSEKNQNRTIFCHIL